MTAGQYWLGGGAVALCVRVKVHIDKGYKDSRQGMWDTKVGADGGRLSDGCGCHGFILSPMMTTPAWDHPVDESYVLGMKAHQKSEGK